MSFKNSGVSKRNVFVINTENDKEISAHINVKCSLQEIVNIFCHTDIKMFSTAMKELYGKNFISAKIDMIKDTVFLKESIFLTGAWKYIKTFYDIENGLIITMKSTDDSSIQADLTYTISIIEDIYSVIKKDTHFNIKFNGIFHNDLAKKLLHKLVKGLEVIPKIIISNRIILQQFIDISRCITDNKYCTNCANKFKSFLGIINSATFICHLCGYNVCRKCILKHKIYQNDNYENIAICKNCIIRLNNCDYSSIDLNLNPYTRIIADPLEYNAGHNVYDRLIKEVITNENSQLVIELILKNKFDPKDFKQRKKLLKYLKENTPLHECNVANQHKRKYKIDIDKNPILLPTDEQERFAIVQKFNSDSLVKNPLLMFICKTINDQLKGLLTLIVIIDDTKSIVVACNNEIVIKKYQRNESICQHIVMTGEPLLVNNPEADIKYGCIPSINTFKSYFSFPVIINNHIIGSFCILGSNPRIITQSEYSLMKKFSSLISTVIINLTTVCE
jgi:hypothetical protein